MSWISRTLGLTGEGFIAGVSKLVRNFKLPPEEETKFLVSMEKLLQRRDSEVEQTIRAELQAKERLLVAELQQDDNFTKRARPTVVYFGLLVIAYNYCVIPTIQLSKAIPLTPFVLPTEFWVAWGGIVTSWVLGRSAEKRGSSHKAVSLLTGNSKLKSTLVE